VKSIPLTPSSQHSPRGSTPPVFERIGIVGLGPSGAAIGLAIRHAWPSALVIGVDGNDALDRAMRWHAVDVGGDDLVMLREADLIVLTGSAEQSIEVLTALQEYVPGAAVVTTTCGDAPGVIEAARALPPQLTFVASGLAAMEHASREPSSGDAGWLAGRVWRLVSAPGETGGAAAVERLRAFATGLGAEPCVVTATAELGSPSNR